MSYDATIVGAIDNARNAQLAYDVLVRDGVAVLPTDTLYGLSARLTSEEGVRRISAIKRAPNDRRYVLLASSIEMVDRFVRSYGCGDRVALAAAWPAPLSIIVPSGPECPAWVGPTVAIRVPALAPLRDLIERLGEPIVSTSVNRTGSDPIDDPHEIRRAMGEEVDLIVTEPAADAVASTIVDLSGTAPRVVRRGSYTWDGAGEAKPSK
jgi:L-threonylcarbamoyladenylate synthase